MAERVAVCPAPPEFAEALARMLDSYLDELGLATPIARAVLPLYWSEPGRWPFLIHAGDTLAGFALVRETAPGARELAEFCVLPPWRGCGIGATAARLVFGRFPGAWRLKAVPGAARFWDLTIAEAGFAAQHEDGVWRIFSVPRA